MTRGTVV